MWLCLPEGFLSIVEDATRPDHVLIRARSKKHLSTIFPGRFILESPHSDYGWRIQLSKKAFAIWLADKAENITYHNFKDQVKEPRLHDLYAGFWIDHLGYQHGAPSRGYGFEDFYNGYGHRAKRRSQGNFRNPDKAKKKNR